MPDRDELDLSALTRTPVGALPGPAAARSRGEQRTRRTRAALAGAGALVAVLALTAGTALSGGTERVAPAPFAVPTPPEAGEEGLAVSLLDPEDLVAVQGAPYAQRPTDDYPFEPLPAGCAAPEEVFGTPAATAVRFLDGSSPYVVGHALKGYSDEAQAQAAFGRVIDSIEACGEADLQLQGGLAGSGPSRSYGTFAVGSERDTVVFAIERIGAVLSGVAIRSFELEDAPPLADAARDAVSGGPFDAPDPGPAPLPPPPGPEAALLDPDAAASVEPGDWRALPLDATPLLAPCGSGPPTGAGVSGTDLRVEREAGGTFVYQQVYDYPSADEAASALTALEQAVVACPSEPITLQTDPDPGMRGTRSYELVDPPAEPLVVLLTTQCEGCQPATSYAAVLQAGPRITVLVVTVAEDGGPSLGLALRYADLARERLEALTGPA